MSQSETDEWFDTGVLAYQSGDIKEAKKWWQLAADAGDSAAMCNMGLLADHSGNVKEAKKWYQLSADAGFSDAMSNLGEIAKQSGDLKEAKKWFELAAEASKAEKFVTVAHAYREMTNHLNYFKRKCPEVLNDYYIWNSKCTNTDDLKQEILITLKRILFTPIIKGWGSTATVRPVEVPFNDIKHLEVSFRHHTTHSPFMSDVTRTWLALNFVTIDDRSFLRFLWVGETETERNENLPNRKEKIKELQQVFDVVEVENYESSSGSSSAPFSIGVFNLLD